MLHFLSQIVLSQSNMPLCVDCDQRFPDQHSLKQHLQSPRHRCDECNRFFKSARSKEQHIRSSNNHRTQTSCGADSSTHLRSSPHERKKRIQQMQVKMIGAVIDDSVPPYIGIPRDTVGPVFKMACRLRFAKPDVDMLLGRIDTQLDRMIVLALIEAALRLLPPDNTPEGRAEAKKKMQKKMEQARLHETAFIDQLRYFGYQFLTEREQKEVQLHPTPDIRFLRPISIQGHLCHWLEYKSYFGFKANPFIASKNKKQLTKYTSELGSGAVVYKLGFEIDHILVAGLRSFREAEVLHSLGRQSRLSK